LDYLVADNQYVYAEWVDVKRNAQYFQLERKPTTSFATDTLMLCMLNLPVWDATTVPNFYLGKWGNVYYSDGTKVGNGLCWGKDIVNATLFNIGWVLYYILYCVDDYTNSTKWNMYYIKVTDAGTSVWSRTSLECILVPWVPTDFAVWDKYNHCRQMTNDSDRLLYYVAGSNLNTIDYLGIYRNRISTDFYITGLTKHNQLFRVYTHCSKIYFWDWYSQAFDWFIDISYNVRYVRNQWDTDYVVLWPSAAKSMLGIFTGQQLQFINKTVKSDVSGITKFQYDLSNHGSNYNMAQYGNIVYMAISWLNDWGMWIASYGSEYRGFPKWVFIESNKTAWSKTMSQIWFIANPLNLGMTLQYSYKDSSNNYFHLSYYQLFQTYFGWCHTYKM